MLLPIKIVQIGRGVTTMLYHNNDSLKAIGTPSPLVNSCITISEVLRTFFIKTIKLYVKSSVKDTIGG